MRVVQGGFFPTALPAGDNVRQNGFASNGTSVTMSNTRNFPTITSNGKFPKN
jgi:hypothetical protein